MVVVKTKCPLCGKTHFQTFTEAQFKKVQEYQSLQRSVPIQDYLPDLTPEQREFLLSGVCNDCWGTDDD